MAADPIDQLQEPDSQVSAQDQKYVEQFHHGEHQHHIESADPADHHAEFLGNVNRRQHRGGYGRVGPLNPLLAAFIHVSSELTFILNSTRLLPRRT